MACVGCEGIELSYLDWKSSVIPLYYTRIGLYVGGTTL